MLRKSNSIVLGVELRCIQENGDTRWKKGEMGGDYSDPPERTEPIVLVWDTSRIGQNSPVLGQGPKGQKLTKSCEKTLMGGAKVCGKQQDT